MKCEIAKFGFLVSIFSYAFFLLCEYLREGFISFVFSVHIFLIPIIVFGFIWSQHEVCSKCNATIIFTIKLLAGVVLMVVLWREGGVFGDLRIIMSLIGFMLPFAMANGLKM